MKSEHEVVSAIIEILVKYDPEDEYSYPDEGEQAELRALEWVLDRDFTAAEVAKLAKRRQEALGYD